MSSSLIALYSRTYADTHITHRFAHRLVGCRAYAMGGVARHADWPARGDSNYQRARARLAAGRDKYVICIHILLSRLSVCHRENLSRASQVSLLLQPREKIRRE